MNVQQTDPTRPATGAQLRPGEAPNDMTDPHMPAYRLIPWPQRPDLSIEAQRVSGARRGGQWQGDGWALELLLLPGELIPVAQLRVVLGPGDRHTGHSPSSQPATWNIWLDRLQLQQLSQPARGGQWLIQGQNEPDFQIEVDTQDQQVYWTVAELDPYEYEEEAQARGHLSFVRSWRQSQRLLVALRQAQHAARQAEAELLAALASGPKRAAGWRALVRRLKLEQQWALLPDQLRWQDVPSACGFNSVLMTEWCAADIWGEWRAVNTIDGEVAREFSRGHPKLHLILLQAAQKTDTWPHEPPELHAALLSM